jgi:hypothetical protein
MINEIFNTRFGTQADFSSDLFLFVILNYFGENCMRIITTGLILLSNYEFSRF